MSSVPIIPNIEAIRRFNRFYTRKFGLLREGHWKSSFTLTEARIISEIVHHEWTTATNLTQELELDPGLMSRILRDFQERELIDMEPAEDDRRQNLLSLTAKGEDAFAQITAAFRPEVEAVVRTLSVENQHRLVQAMAIIEELLAAKPENRGSYILRPHRSGDIGWVIHRHGVLYNQQFGWNEDFEALVAEVATHFIRNYDPTRERCWIAEKDGENVGSVFLVKHPDQDGVAKLRLLLVEPAARGLGIGKRLVRECTHFGRQVGYRRITLWTNSILDAARSIYEREGYRLVHEEPHHSFGHDLVGQTWELDL